MTVVGTLFPWMLNSFHWFLLRLARACLNRDDFDFLSLVTVVVDMMCLMVLVILDFPASTMFSRSILLHSGAPSRLLSD